MKSNESFRDLGDLNALRRLHQTSKYIKAPARHNPPMAAIEMPTDWAVVRFVARSVDPCAGIGGRPVAGACVCEVAGVGFELTADVPVADAEDEGIADEAVVSCEMEEVV
jgi:hypothetical protein